MDLRNEAVRANGQFSNEGVRFSAIALSGCQRQAKLRLVPRIAREGVTSSAPAGQLVNRGQTEVKLAVP
jgi:hypothetical protein